jgi:hypothetical protein
VEAAVTRAGLQAVVNQLWRALQNLPAAASLLTGPGVTAVIDGIPHRAAAAGLRGCRPVNGVEEAPVVSVESQHLCLPIALVRRDRGKDSIPAAGGSNFAAAASAEAATKKRLLFTSSF